MIRGGASHVVLLLPRRPLPPTQLLLMADSLRPRFQSFTDSILSHRVFLYTFASTLAVSATVANALQNQSNFYSVAVYLSKSGASVLVAFSCIFCLLAILLSSPDPRQL